jgi:thiol-disulfide isomerase/thioredoxin
MHSSLSKSNTWLLAFCVGANLLLCGCSLDQLKAPFNLFPPMDFSDAEAQPAVSSPTSAVVQDLANFQTFPFEVNAVDIVGQPIRSSDYRGKVVIVDFWGTWCGPCRRVIPHLVHVQSQYADDVQVIGLCNERTSDTQLAHQKLAEAIREFGINYPCSLIDDQAIRKVPDFRGYPTMLFIDRAGTVRLTTVGIKPDQYWNEVLDVLIAEPAQPASQTGSTSAR